MFSLLDVLFSLNLSLLDDVVNFICFNGENEKKKKKPDLLKELDI